MNALVPAEEEAAAQRAALERLRSRTPYRPVSIDGRAEELRRSAPYLSTAQAFARVFEDTKNAELAARAHRRP